MAKEEKYRESKNHARHEGGTKERGSSRERDRPGGMDDLKFHQPGIHEKTPVMKSEMGKVAEVAAGAVDSSNSGAHLKHLSGDTNYGEGEGEN